jgi:hypothetical protein
MEAIEYDPGGLGVDLQQLWGETALRGQVREVERDHHV